MSQIHAVTQRDEHGNAYCTLALPEELLTKLNTAEETRGEQAGASYRDRVLQVLAAMVISSIDSFRVSELYQLPVGNGGPGQASGDVDSLTEDKNNGDKDGH